MMKIYEVVVATESVEYVSKIFGLWDALMMCAEAGECDNVLGSHVMDCETGEIMFQMEDGEVAWVSGLGDPRE